MAGLVGRFSTCISVFSSYSASDFAKRLASPGGSPRKSNGLERATAFQGLFHLDIPCRILRFSRVRLSALSSIQLGIRAMALSRDSRMDRRQQMLRDASNAESTQASGRANRADLSANDDASQNGTRGRRDPGYSQDVRYACGVRLVQLIPVRMVSFATVVGLFIAITATLLTAHYMIYVSGSLGWYGHPLAVSLDATHPQSIASWLGSHMWLLCLTTTILTFQLRRHKLDDYRGEYRLWFWLVFTCLLASIDSTTHLTELLGYALDRWSQLHLGWSGKALVHSTMAVLVGVLGVRLISELKAVPLSLICWLGGLIAWAGSAALAQDALRLDITLQMRYWLRAALWLGGLTAIWIAALSYLRHVYIEAQRRFLARGKLARRNTEQLARQNGQTTGRRLSPRVWWQALPAIGRRQSNADAQTERESSQRRPKVALSQRTSPQVAVKSESVSAQSEKRWSFSLWPGRASRDDDAPEYHKSQRIAGEVPEHDRDATRRAEAAQVKDTAREAQRNERAAQKQERRAQRQAARETKRSAKEANKSGKRFFLFAPLAAVGGLFGKLKLPSLSGLKLQPPEPLESVGKSTQANSVQGLRPVTGNKPFPRTQRPDQSTDDDDSQDSDRHLSRAERKQLRRQGRAA